MHDSFVTLSETAQSIPFDNESNGFAADRVQAAIEETVFSNFSFKNVASNRTITIPEDQQMLVYQEMRIAGLVLCLGDLVVL